MATQEIITELVIDARGAVTGSETYERAMLAAQRAVDRLVSAEQKKATETESSEQRSTQAIANTAKAYQRLAESLDPVLKASNDLARSQKLVDDEFIRGGISAAEREKQLAALNRRSEETTRVMTGAAGAVKLTSYQVTNLGYQVQDLAVQLVSGQSPFMAIAQQAPQAASAVGGFGNLIKLMISPTAALVAGLVALGGAVVLTATAMSSHSSELKAFDLALATTGQRVGYARSELMLLGEAAGEVSGTTAREGRNIALALTQAGTVSGESLKKAAELSRDFGTAIGKTAAEGATELAKRLEDPVAGVKDLDRAVQFADANLVSYVKTLSAQGRQEEARLAILERLGPKLQGLADNQLGTFGRVWKYISDQASKFYDTLSKIGSAPQIDLKATLADLQANMAKLQATASTPSPAASGVSGLGMVPLKDRFDREQAGQEIEAVQNEIEHVQELIRQYRMLSVTRSTKEDRDLVMGAKDLADRYDVLGVRVRNLTNMHQLLGRTLDALAKENSSNIGLWNQLTDAYEAYGIAMESQRSPHQLVVDGLTDEAKVLAAPIAQRRLLNAELQISREWLADLAKLETGEKTATELNVEADLKRANALRQISQEIRDEITIRAENVAGLDRLTLAYTQGAAAVAEAEKQNRIELEVLQKGEAFRAKITTSINAETEARKRNTAAIFDAGIRDQIADAKTLAEAELAGVAALHDAEIAVRAMQQARKEGKENDQQRLKDLREEIALEQKWVDVRAVRGQINQQNQELELGRAELALVGASVQQREIVLSQLRAEIELRKYGKELSESERAIYLANAEALATLKLEIDRNGEALKEISQFGERSFDAVLTAITSADTATSNWGKTLKALGTEFEQLAARMLLINPVKNSVFGTNLPTLSNLLSVTASSPSVATSSGSGGFNLFGSITNSLQSGYANVNAFGQRMFPSLFGGSGDLAGAQLADAAGFGAGGSSVGTPGLLGETSLGGILGGAGIGFGVGSILGKFTKSRTTGALGGAFSGALSGAMMGGLPGAFIGGAAGLLGGILGGGRPSVGPGGNIWFNTDSTGAYTRTGGAGDNGYDFTTVEPDAKKIVTQLQAFAKELGTTYGGTQGGSLVLGYNAGTKRYESSLGTPTGYQDVGSFEQYGDAVAHALFLGVKKADWSKAGQDVAEAIKNSSATALEGLQQDAAFGQAFRRTIAGALATGDAAATQRLGIANTAEDAGKALAKQITDFKKKTDELYPSIARYEDQVKSVTRTITDLETVTGGTGDSTYEQVISTQREVTEQQTVQVEVGRQLSEQSLAAAAAMKAQVLGAMGLVATTEPLRGSALAIEILTKNMQAMRPALEAVGIVGQEATDKINEAIKKGKDQIATAFTDTLDAALNEATGRAYRDSIKSAVKSFDQNVIDAADSGIDSVANAKIQQLFESQLRSVISGLDATQLQDVMTTFASSNKTIVTIAKEAAAALNEQAKATEAAAVAAATAAAQARAQAQQEVDDTATSIQARVLTAQGRGLEADLLTFDASAMKQRLDLQNQLTAAGHFMNDGDARGIMDDYAVTVVKQLEIALAAERLAIEKKYADQSLQLQRETDARFLQMQVEVTSNQISIISDSIQKLTEDQAKYSQAAASLKSTRESLLVGEFSTLDPEAKLTEARRQFLDTAQRAQSNKDVDAMAQLQGLAQAYLKANDDFWATSNPAAFKEVQDVLNSTEDVATYSARLAEDQLAVERQQLDVLQRQLAELQNKVSPPTPTVAENVLVKQLSSMLDTEFAQITALAQRLGYDTNNPAVNAQLRSGAGDYSLLGGYGPYSDIMQFFGEQIRGVFRSANPADIPDAIRYADSIGNPGYSSFIQGLAAARGIASPLKQYASGGDPPVGQVVMVGEHGPEQAVFTSPVRVYPHGSRPNVQSTSFSDTNIVRMLNSVVTELREVRKVTAASGTGVRSAIRETAKASTPAVLAAERARFRPRSN